MAKNLIILSDLTNFEDLLSETNCNCITMTSRNLKKNLSLSNQVTYIDFEP